MGYATSIDCTTPRSFSQELHEAIRSDHIALNKLITARLPLCLPPHTHNPVLYAKGMIVFGDIYRIFESQMKTVLHGRAPGDRILKSIAYLHDPNLHRSHRLQADLAELQHRLEIEHFRQLGNDTLQAAQLTSSVERKLLAEKPYLLFAYAWTMYLAIFNGGRYILKQLRDAGQDYWMGPPPLSFWEFEGEQDGEDIKDHFKKNIEAAARLLTRKEKDDVITEGKKIFKLCTKLVRELDHTAMEGPATVLARAPHTKASGIRANLWTAFGYAGLLCLLSVSWQVLYQSYVS